MREKVAFILSLLFIGNGVYYLSPGTVIWGIIMATLTMPEEWLP